MKTIALYAAQIVYLRCDKKDNVKLKKKIMVSYSMLSRAFADVKNLEVPALGRFIGGKVGQNIVAGTFKNGCAIRMSYAFNRSGNSISSNDGAVSSGADGSWYLYRVKDFITFVKKTINGASLSGNSAASFYGKKGVIVFSGCGWGDATGHIDLFDGSKVEGTDYFPNCSNAVLYIIG